MPEDLRDATRVLMELHDARAFVCVRSGDELLGVIAIPRATRS